MDQNSTPNVISYFPNDIGLFINNINKIFTLLSSNLALSANYAKANQENITQQLISDGIKELQNVHHLYSKYYSSNNISAVYYQNELLLQYNLITQYALMKNMGFQATPVISPLRSDRRFKAPLWTELVFYDCIKQAYLVTSKWLLELVPKLNFATAKEKDRAVFFVKQTIAAFSPSNFLPTNPDLLNTTMQENGANLVKGCEEFIKRLQQGRNILVPKQTDLSSFEVGKNLAITPGKVIWQNEICQIINYEPSTKEVYKIPIVLTPPWINKYYILDLVPERSMIKWMVDQGFNVFTISWINPTKQHSHYTLSDYARLGIQVATDIAKKITRSSKVNLVGYCVGGTLSAMYMGYLASKSGRVTNPFASATLLTTQTDFSKAGDLKLFTGEKQLELLEKSLKKTGYMGKDSMAAVFNLLRSDELFWNYIVDNYLLNKKPKAFDLLYWNSDSTRIPYANHIEYLRECYLKNNLSKGLFELNDVKVDLGKVTTPLYMLATKEDHIAPAVSIYESLNKFNSDLLRLVIAESGHIAGVVRPPGVGKYGYWSGEGNFNKKLEEWLEQATFVNKSWWTDWNQWLIPFSGPKVPSKAVGLHKDYPPLENAPGSYVKMS